MNERIKELAVQAGLDAEEIRDDGSLTLYAFEEFDLEQFAELIVQECIKLNGKELAMAGHSRMVDVYCEHFGIDYERTN